MSFSWFSFLLSQLWIVPGVLVALAGMMIAVARWQRHPQVSACAFFGFSAFFMNHMAWFMFQVWQRFGRQSAENIQSLFPAMRLVSTLLYLVGFILLIVAIFGWRSTPRTYENTYSNMDGK